MGTMKIAIINDVHTGKPLVRDNKMRAASHLAEDALPLVLNHIITQHAPDLLVNLGDLIRSENREMDRLGYQQSIHHFSHINCPVLHILGNHELKCLSAQEIEAIWNHAGFLQRSYGVKECEGITLIWIGMEYQPAHLIKHKLPGAQLAWLEKTLQQLKQPAILFTHCAIDGHDVSGNYFYEGHVDKNTHGFFLENYEDIQRLISACKHVQMVAQAHMHYFHSKIIDKVPYVTCPAMGDNICAPTVDEHMPEIYSLLTISDTQLALKAFSREYCFAGAEFERR